MRNGEEEDFYSQKKANSNAYGDKKSRQIHLESPLSNGSRHTIKENAAGIVNIETDNESTKRGIPHQAYHS